MNQPNTATRLEVVDIETLEVKKAVYMTTLDPQQIQAMSDSLLRNLNTFQFFVRAVPSAAPEVAEAVAPALTDERIKEEMHAYFSYSGNSDNKFWAHVDDIVLFAQWVAAQVGQPSAEKAV